MNKENRNTATPTFEALPAMVAELSRKFDDFVQGQEKREKPKDSLQTPMGIRPCAEFLTEIEGKTVTVGAVYNRVNKGRLPYRKNGAKLYFLRDEILKAMQAPKKPATQFHEVVKSY